VFGSELGGAHERGPRLAISHSENEGSKWIA
jgi:hypothetical protein